MCGRYALTVDPETLFGTFAAELDAGVGGPAALYGGDEPRPRYNIAPTVIVPVVRLDPRVRDAVDDGRERGRQVEPMRWGLVPSWAKDPSVGNRMFNARAESLADKPAFRRALAKRRCLIPASGWYEWRKLADAASSGSGGSRGRKAAKQAYFMTPQDGSVLAFGGLWEYWKPAPDPDGDGDPSPIISMTIVTTDAVGPLQDIHERMPMVLAASEWSDWLDPDVDPTPLLSPPSLELVEGLELRPIGPRVGSVDQDDPDLLRRVDVVDAAAGSAPAARAARTGTRSTGRAGEQAEQQALPLEMPNPA